MRPPVSTWDLMTVGPPMRSAISLGLGGVCGEPVVRDRDPGALDDLAGLVFEEPHGGAGPYPERAFEVALDLGASVDDASCG